MTSDIYVCKERNQRIMNEWMKKEEKGWNTNDVIRYDWSNYIWLRGKTRGNTNSKQRGDMISLSIVGSRVKFSERNNMKFSEWEDERFVKKMNAIKWFG